MDENNVNNNSNENIANVQKVENFNMYNPEIGKPLVDSTPPPPAYHSAPSEEGGFHLNQNKGTYKKYLHYMRVYQMYLDKIHRYLLYRWVVTAIIALAFFSRVIFGQGWYVVAYCFGIYILNLFVAFLSPLGEEEEDEIEILPPSSEQKQWKPFIRQLPEFKFWYLTTKALIICTSFTFFRIFDIPVYYPILLFYWILLTIVQLRKRIQHMMALGYVPWNQSSRKQVD